jgi:hypothetical protein
MFDEYDKFAKLRAIDSGQATASTAQNVRFWSYEKDGNLMGTIIKFDRDTDSACVTHSISTKNTDYLYQKITPHYSLRCIASIGQMGGRMSVVTVCSRPI